MNNNIECRGYSQEKFPTKQMLVLIYCTQQRLMQAIQQEALKVKRVFVTLDSWEKIMLLENNLDSGVLMLQDSKGMKYGVIDFDCITVFSLIYTYYKLIDQNWKKYLLLVSNDDKSEKRPVQIGVCRLLAVNKF